MTERRSASRNRLPPQFSARTLDSTDLVDVPSDYYTHVFCIFGIMMVPDALNEMFPVLEPSGTIGMTIWHKIDRMPIFLECLARAKMPFSKIEDATARRAWQAPNSRKIVLVCKLCTYNIYISWVELRQKIHFGVEKIFISVWVWV